MKVTSLVENTQYYSNARVTDALGNISDVVSSDGFKMDYTGPEKGSLIAPNFTSGIIELSWSGFSDNGSGINHYYYMIGDDTNTQNILARTETLELSAITPTLSLETGVNYYARLWAVDNVGNNSLMLMSDAIVYDAYPGKPTITSFSMPSGTSLGIFNDVTIEVEFSETSM